SRSVAIEGGISRIRRGNRRPAAGEHDRIRQIAAAPVRGIARPGLSDGHLSAERISCFHESHRRIFARLEKALKPGGLVGKNADASRALPVARLRSGKRSLGRASRGMTSLRMILFV